MFSDVWCSRPIIVEPSSLMPCECNSRASVRVSLPCSFPYEACGDSSPIQIQEMPRPTNSSIEYWRMALAEANTYNAQALFALFMRSRSSSARLRSEEHTSELQ